MSYSGKLVLHMVAPSTDTQPLVSVIMPSYNTARYIGEAIDSVLSQDYPNKELIVIDDGSTDATVDIIRSYSDRVRLITQRNQGAAVARNAGLDAAQGDYIAFLDSDDCWLPGKLRTQIDYLEQYPDIGMVYARWQVWKPELDGRFDMPAIAESSDADRSSPPIVPERSGWLYNRLLFTSLLHTITVVARRSLIETVGRFDTELKRGQDYDYWIRASRAGEIHQLDRVFALYRVHGNGCAKKWPNENYELMVVEKALNRWGLTGPNGEITPTAAIRKRLADTCFSFGYHHYHEGDLRLAAQSFAQATIRHPVRPASWRYLAMSTLKYGASGLADVLRFRAR